MPIDKTKLLFLPCCIAAACLLQTGMEAQNTGAIPRPRTLITQRINNSARRVLAGNTRAEANAQNDRGRVSDDLPVDHMLLQLKRPPELEKAFEAFIETQHDSASPNFQKWLTADQVGERYGVSSQDLDSVTGWLTSQGFTVGAVYPSRMSIDFSGNAGQVYSAFRTEIHNLSVDGVEHIANMSDPQIPEALAPAVTGVVSLHDFKPRAMRKPRAKYTAPLGKSTYRAMVPGDLATIYDLNPLFATGVTGQGQTIALVEDSDLYSAADWTTFRNTFGLAKYSSGSLVTTHPAPRSGRNNCADPGVNSDAGEASLDAEWASASAPGASIVLAACADTNTTFGILIAMQNLINSASPPPVISLSYGVCEAFNGSASNASINSAYQQAVSQGISIFVSSGDEGAAGCDAGQSAAVHGIGVSAFASTPYNVSVGGTDFADSYLGTASTFWNASNTAVFDSAISYVPEIPWNDSCSGALFSGLQGYSATYGSSGFCASDMAARLQLQTVAAGSGGPSGCASGAPSSIGVVGGSCAGYPKPSWQAGLPGIPDDGVRGTPDISLFAADGLWGHFYVYCWSDRLNGGDTCSGEPINWSGAGGTSFSSPILAGIQALVNQKAGGPQGNPNPVYYKLAAGPLASTVFHPITMGDITVNCAQGVNCYSPTFQGRGRLVGTPYPGNGTLSTSSQTLSPAFAATAGWNFATGIGSVDAYNLVINWKSGQ